MDEEFKPSIVDEWYVGNINEPGYRKFRIVDTGYDHILECNYTDAMGNLYWGPAQGDTSRAPSYLVRRIVQLKGGAE